MVAMFFRRAMGRTLVSKTAMLRQFPSGAVLAIAATGGMCVKLYCDEVSATKQIARCGCWRKLHDLTAAESSQSATGKVVLVTGAAGFIGYHCALALKKRGDGVIGIDNYCDYYPVSLKQARTEHLMKEGIYTFNADINERHFLDHILKEYKVTHILTLAAQAGVRYEAQDPASYVASNVSGFVSILEAARYCKPMPRIVYASSSSVYGLNAKIPFVETDKVDHPSSLYAATKKGNEMIAHTYTHIYGLSLIGLRYFTVYGPMGRPDMAIFTFTQKIMNGETLQIFQGPDGREIERDFTYIDDAVAGTLAALDAVTPSTKPTAQCSIINLGKNEPFTVTHLVNCIEDALGKKAVKQYVQVPQIDLLKTHADTTKAEKELNHRATTSLKVGVANFVEWYKAYLQQKPAEDVIEFTTVLPRRTTLH
eukprot:gnl/MRDRNA2_/MRDRNA2_77131_c1_seq1.p1 gnl/MRDRNA2_/MRDRNA2_77131_c1~~gnl/MRDRNA2_/MRDRNA2_77131_c1_seq1.p1  ORF type:complete len:424 (-),score=58.28 gnl/MRDRNA2_/MRDRNA2_77131_c1_seq1:492-1763(-)